MTLITAVTFVVSVPVKFDPTGVVSATASANDARAGRKL
jgi:hypothetical protein